MYHSQQIAELIRIQTTSKKISIRKMLKDIGLGVNSLSHMDNGSMPKADNLAKVADYLNVSTDYLLGRTDEPTGTTSGHSIKTGDINGDNNANINAQKEKTSTENNELIDLIQSLSLVERSKVVLFIDEMKKDK
ncbi:MAG: helix-turn-helix domain-containing protein [Lachnospiraceae bacterium]|nr:helix-turn-helix domain-containing protein [Lachnospiraceae bacterium]MCM1237274.1 helix-turn-helix domain-containing protein [Ruminococcus flavefaciens]